MEPAGKQRVPVTAATVTANDAPAAVADGPFFVFIASADAGYQESTVCYCTDERDWKNLLPDLVSKVADHALRSDVTDYIRLRAVCKPWRSAAKEDPKLMGMDPRFFPRNWEMVAEEKARGEETRFVHGITGASMQLQIPRRYGDVIASAEGCLVLALRRTCKQEMWLFNPVTRAVADLPCLFTDAGNQIISQLSHAAGLVYDGEADANPTVVLPMPVGNGTVGLYAKPGNTVWRLLALEDGDGLVMCLGGLSVRGRFYVPTCTGDVLKLELQPQPHLAYVARQEARHMCGRFGVISYLVPSLDDADDGMLLVRSFESGEHEFFRVKLKEGSLTMLLQPEEIVNKSIFVSWLTLGTE